MADCTILALNEHDNISIRTIRLDIFIFIFFRLDNSVHLLNLFSCRDSAHLTVVLYFSIVLCIFDFDAGEVTRARDRLSMLVLVQLQGGHRVVCCKHHRLLRSLCDHGRSLRGSFSRGLGERIILVVIFVLAALRFGLSFQSGLDGFIG